MFSVQLFLALFCRKAARRMPATFRRLWAIATIPNSVNLFQPHQGKPAERPIALDATKYALYLDFTLSIDCGFLVITKSAFRFCFQLFPYRVPVNLAVAFSLCARRSHRTITAFFTLISLKALLQARALLFRQVLFEENVSPIGAVTASAHDNQVMFF